MPLLTVVLVIILAGVLLWLVNTYVPMDAKLKNILNIVVVVAVIIWLLSLFLPLDMLNTVRVGHPR